MVDGKRVMVLLLSAAEASANKFRTTHKMIISCRFLSLLFFWLSCYGQHSLVEAQAVGRNIASLGSRLKDRLQFSAEKGRRQRRVAEGFEGKNVAAHARIFSACKTA